MKLHKNLTSALKERTEVSAIKLSIKGSFPVELFDFPNLEEVYLEGDCSDLPNTIAGWSKLKLLSLKWPGFKGNLSHLFCLPKLENLKVIETPVKTFLLPLGQVPAPLRFLTLKSCGLQKLPEEFSMLSGLEDLHLGGNELNELPHSFHELQKLKRLNLDQNNFKKFPDQIKGMKTLSHLSIDGNKFSEDEKARIQREFHIWVN
jgi:Leucine-rich repeat (LRR) protein